MGRTRGQEQGYKEPGWAEGSQPAEPEDMVSPSPFSMASGCAEGSGLRRQVRLWEGGVAGWGAFRRVTL